MDLDDTIAAIATPPGRGGIGVVRLAGPQARAIAELMLRLSRPLEPNHAQLCDLIEPRVPHPSSAWVGTVPAEMKDVVSSTPPRLDEVVVTYFARPHSYTTDDIVEISAHGSPVVLRHILELSLAQGARLAEPGEFTLRAFLNGRLDLTQAEAVRDLIDSQTLFQAKVAAQQLEGALSNRLKPIKRDLIDLIALLEAGIDFAEDDVSIAADSTIQARIAAVHAPLAQLAATFAYGNIVHQGLTLAIVGRPNVGKSSLFNCLVERERAIVTAQPGTTRDLVSETVAIGGIPVQLVDTAGIRQPLHEDEAESLGIKKSMEALAAADLVLVVTDITQPPAQEDDQLLTELLTKTANRPAILVENKSDLLGSCGDGRLARPGRAEPGRLSPAESSGVPHPSSAWVGTLPPPPAERSSATRPIIQTSALTGDGIPALRAAILRHIAGDSAPQLESGFLTSLRHQTLVNDSLTALAAATTALSARVPHEMLLLDLYVALHSLDEITGATTSDDILSCIFSTFCIGK